MGKSIPVSRWVEIAPLERIQEDTCCLFEYGDDRVIVYRSGDVYTAVAGTCTHHGNKLDGGMVVHHELTCPWHSSSFDITTASCLSPPALENLQQYDTKMKDGMLFLKRRKPEAASIELRRESGTFLIIGNGAAGMAAAVTLRREGFDGRLIMVTAEAELTYDRTRLSKNFLSNAVDKHDVYIYSREFFNIMKIELLMGRQVAGIDPNEKQIVFMDGDFLLYDRLLIATGSIPVTPLIPGTDLSNFYLLRNIRDALSIAEAAKHTKRTLIMGAGFIGMEAAAVLREMGLEVHVVAPEKIPFAHVFGKRVGERILNMHRERGVQFHLGKTVTALKGEGRVQSAELSDESLLDVDLVVCGIGAVPATHFLEDAGIVEGGEVPVDEQMCTAVQDIYAAGDIALLTPGSSRGHGRGRDRRQSGSARNSSMETHRRIQHWTEAVQQGQHAARSMMGSNQPYTALSSFWTQQYEHVIRFAGYIPRIRRVFYRGDVEKGEFIAAYFRRGRLCALCGLGLHHEFMTLHHLLRGKSSIGRKELQNGRFQTKGYEAAMTS